MTTLVRNVNQRSDAARAALAEVTGPGGDACWTYHGDADPGEHARVVHAVLRGPLDPATPFEAACGNTRCVRPGPGHRQAHAYKPTRQDAS